MAVTYNIGQIVRSGLVLHLDAANKKSYSGSGNTWYDLSGNNNNGILNGNAGNPTWNSNGYWSFSATVNGLDNGIKILDSTSLRLSTMTVEIVFTLETKTIISGDNAWMAIFSKTISGTQAPAISVNQTINTHRYLHIETPTGFNSSANLFTDYTGNTWYYVTATFSTSSFGYLNGTQVSTLASGISSTNSDIYLGLDFNDELFKGKMAIVRVYNRVLNFSEIVQNFNALKRRFSL